VKVWIVNPFDNLPTEGFRPQRYWLMAGAFAAAGHDTVLWTQDWSHALKARRAPSVFCGDGAFAVKPIPVPGYTKNISFRRLWSHWRFAVNWRRAAEMEVKAGNVPDVIVLSSPPLYVGKTARAFCRNHSVRMVVDVMDAWPETFERVVPRFTLGWMRRIAGGNYRGADAVSAVARRYLELAHSYGSTAPQKLCYHGIKLPLGFGSAPSRRREGVKRLVYAGNMSLSYDLATVIDAVKSEPSLSLDLAGSGPDEPFLRQRAGDCERIRFHGYLSESGLRRLLEDSDAGVVPMFDDSCVGVPYKLADYAAAGLPMISSLHGETERLLIAHGAGTVCVTRDPSSFLAAIADLDAAVRSGRVTVASIAALASAFDADRLYPDYVCFVESIL
jgi:glycosyltransferase involved in cell wall biosynthesis